jgi:hypothetical protein
MSSALPKIGPQVEVGDGFIRIEDFIFQNDTLVALLKETPVNERLEVLQTILKFGAETYRIFGTTASAESIEKVALKIASDIDGKGEHLVNGVQEIAKQMVAKTGELSVRSTLEAWRTEFAELLNSNFNIENKASILSKFDELIEKKAKSQNAEIVNKLDFNVPDSAINLLQKNISEHVTLQLGELGKKVEDINVALATAAQAKTDKKKQASRGNDLEDDLFDIISTFANTKNDTVDNPGKRKVSGLSGNNEGDLTVELSAAETHGQVLNFVWEGKLKVAGSSAASLITELDKGIANRGSKAGIIVVEKFAGLNLETGEFFKELKSNMAVLVVDPLDIDVSSVRFAYLWARWKCLQNIGVELDTVTVDTSLKAVLQSLKSIVTMRTNNTKAVGLIETNGGLIDRLESEVNAEIEKLSQIIKEVNSANQAE